MRGIRIWTETWILNNYHMRYSNWKKLVGMGEWFHLLHLWDWITISYMAILALMLSTKFQKALEGLSETRATFQGLTDSLSEGKNQDWRGRRNRPWDRGDALNIYEVQQENGSLVLHWVSWFGCWPSYAVPSQADNRLNLTENENESGTASPGW